MQSEASYVNTKIAEGVAEETPTPEAQRHGEKQKPFAADFRKISADADIARNAKSAKDRRK